MYTGTAVRSGGKFSETAPDYFLSRLVVSSCQECRHQYRTTVLGASAWNS